MRAFLYTHTYVYTYTYIHTNQKSNVTVSHLWKAHIYVMHSNSTLMDPHPLKYTYIQTVCQVSLLGFAAIEFLIVCFMYFYVSHVTYYFSPSPHAICI